MDRQFTSSPDGDGVALCARRPGPSVRQHLKNNKGERFMFNYISERFAPETADASRGGPLAEATRRRAGRPSCSRATRSRAPSPPR
jgi:hypothetical protein